MAIVKVGDQNTMDISELHKVMDIEFKHLEHELNDQGLRNSVPYGCRNIMVGHLCGILV